MQGYLRKFILILSLVAVLTAGLSACTGAGVSLAPTETPTPANTVIRRPTPKATAGPVVPTLVVVNQRIGSDNLITLKTVATVHAGFVSIHPDSNGRPAAASIGYKSISKGSDNNMTVLITKTGELTPKLWAMLHIDNGRIGTFEFPGPDIQIVLNGKPLQVSFNVYR